MGDAANKPIFLSQNRLDALLASRAERVAFYARVLDRRIAETAAGATGLRVPAAHGLHRRLAGKPFHGDPEFFFQESGLLHFELPEQALTLKAGEVALIPAGLPHGERWTGRFLNVIFMAQPDGFSLHLGYLRGGVRCGPADRFLGPTERIVRYAEELAEEAAGEETGRRNAALRQGLMLGLLARLREGLEQPTPGREVGPPLLRRCHELIEAHYARLDFSVTWLARALGCSADHLSRLFRRHTGRRLVEFVHDRRVRQARRLLRESTMSVAEVAWACGFSRPSYFNRIFRARVHLTPRAFRVDKIGADPRP